VQEIVQFINSKNSLSLENATNKQNIDSFGSTEVKLLTLGVIIHDLNIISLMEGKG